MSIREDSDYTYYDGYKIPKHYTIPPDYGFSSAKQSTTQSESIQTKTETQIQSQTIEAAVGAGMVGLFGGFAIGRVSKRKKEVKKKDGS